MSRLVKAQKFIATSPREALADALGLAGFAVLIFAGMLLPALI